MCLLAAVSCSAGNVLTIHLHCHVTQPFNNGLLLRLEDGAIAALTIHVGHYFVCQVFKFEITDLCRVAAEFAPQLVV